MCTQVVSYESLCSQLQFPVLLCVTLNYIQFFKQQRRETTRPSKARMISVVFTNAALCDTFKLFPYKEISIECSTYKNELQRNIGLHCTLFGLAKRISYFPQILGESKFEFRALTTFQIYMPIF
jgi:hypothetical protein